MATVRPENPASDGPLPRLSPRRILILPVVMLAAVPAALAVRDAGRDAPLLLVLVVATIALLAVPATVIFFASPRRGRLRLQSADGSTVLLPPVGFAPVAAIAPFVAVLAVPVAVIDVVRDTYTGWTLVVPLVGVLALPEVVKQVRGRRHLGLALSSSGLRVGADPEVPWEVGVHPSLHLGLVPRLTLTEETTLDARLLGSDPRLVTAFVGHYAGSPRDRSELNDGRAIDRARRGDF